MAAPRVFGMVLAGGEGKRLAPLTADRAKPAVPFGGNYRLIDFALSNLVNAGLRRIVVLTHLHYDHSGYLAAFPRARFWVQERELAFWTGRHAARGEIGRIVEPPDIVELVRLNFERRVRFVAGDEEMADGIGLHLVGGHAPGLQVVTVETGDGPLVLASDAAHFYANLELDRPYTIVHSLPGMYDAFDRVRALAGGDDARIVPGHDPLVLERFPAASAELAGVAVALAG